MPTKSKQIIELQLEKCKPCCDRQCYPNTDRHYPYTGTLDIIGEPKYRSIELIRINIMIGPRNRLHTPWAALKTLDSPKGYKFHTSVHEGAEDWNRYYWWTGRVFPLAPGDVFQEKFYARPKTSLTFDELNQISPESEAAYRIIHVYRNFLVIDDSENKLKFLRIKTIPTDPIALLKTLRC